MSVEHNKELVRRFWKAFEANDRGTLEETVSPQFKAQAAGTPAPLTREMLLQGVTAFSAAFSDRNFTIDEIIAEGNQVATRTTLRGVHTGTWQGHPPTGKSFATTGLSIERIEDGKIVEHWFSFDANDALQQLGVVPAPASS